MTERGPPDPPMNDRIAEQSRNFLLGLFMGLRTAQIHDTENQAFKNALLAVHDTANTLYKSTGGFRIQFVDEAIFMNGARLRVERSAFSSMRALKGFLEQQDVGGIAMSGPPSYDSIERLVLGLVDTRETKETALGTADDVELLGVQMMAEDAEVEVKVDRRVLAVQSYGKLLIAMRELLEHAERGGTELPRSRIRAVRVIQDVVELVSDRPDFILRLAMNRRGTDTAELHGVNVALLSIAMGAALGLSRRLLVDLGVAGLFHHVACRRHRFQGKLRLGTDSTLASLGHLMFQSGAGDSCNTRAMIVASHRTPANGTTRATHEPPSLGAKILGVATAYDQLSGGFGTRHEALAHPLEVLSILFEDTTGRFDADLVDLLINMFRAFPEGCEVVLDDGSHAIVESHLGSSRWDRPVVRVLGSKESVDLMRRTGDRFQRRILATPRYRGRTSRSIGSSPAPASDLAAPPIGYDEPPASRDEAPLERESVDAMFQDYLADND